jgi:hypothetical protein
VHSLLCRLVAEMNSERKLKSHKGKPKTSEGRMHLSNVRVIQRNLVYIIGLPLNIADESVSILAYLCATNCNFKVDIILVVLILKFKLLFFIYL